MTSSVRRLLLLVAALWVASGAAAIAAQPFDPFAAAAIEPQSGQPLPGDLRFTDQTGAEVSLGALTTGLPSLVVPVYYDCPNICLGTLAGLFAGLAEMPLVPGRDYRVVAVSFASGEGPQDAAQALAAARKRFPAASAEGFHFLTGERRAIDSLMGAIGFSYAWNERIGQYAHAAGVLAVTADGRQGRWLYGVAPEPKDLKLALVDAGDGAVGSLADRLLLLCYQYDPVTGRYGSLVQGLLRGAGAATVLALAGFLVVSLRRERERRR